MQRKKAAAAGRLVTNHMVEEVAAASPDRFADGGEGTNVSIAGTKKKVCTPRKPTPRGKGRNVAFATKGKKPRGGAAVATSARTSPVPRPEFHPPREPPLRRDGTKVAVTAAKAKKPGSRAALASRTYPPARPEVHPPTEPTRRETHSLGPSSARLPSLLSNGVGASLPPPMANSPGATAVEGIPLARDIGGGGEISTSATVRDDGPFLADGSGTEPPHREASLYRVGGAVVVVSEESAGQRRSEEGDGSGSGHRASRADEVLWRRLMERVISVDAVVAEQKKEEERSKQRRGSTAAWCIRWRCHIFASSFVLIVAAIVGTTVPLLMQPRDGAAGEASNTPDWKTVDLPDQAAVRYGLIQSVLIDAIREAGLPPESVKNLVYDREDGTATPQHRALAWLSNDDGLRVNPSDSRSLVQRYALVTFFFATGGGNWTDDCDFLSSKNECEWNRGGERQDLGWTSIAGLGVFCELGEVWILYFPLNNLSGHLPEEIGLLSQLRIFLAPNVNYTRQTNGDGLIWGDYLGSKVSGTIPESLSLLRRLGALYLENHNISGTIPASMFDSTSNLKTVSLIYNQLTGSIPPSFSSSRALHYADFDSNLLTGELPSLGNLGNLTYFSIWENAMTGTIPPDINNMKKLIGIYLNYNFFSGTIPLVQDSLPELEILQLGPNNLSGTIPTSIFSYSKLTSLHLRENNLTGKLPEEVGLLSNLNFLNVQNNLLTGTIPSTVGDAANLSGLLLSYNYFSGTIPTKVGNLKKLRKLFLHNNLLEGPISESIGSLLELDFLMLHWNRLAGRVPRNFEQLTKLGALFIDGNELTGVIDFLCNVTLIYADCLEPNAKINCSCCDRCCKDFSCDPPRENENLDDVHLLQMN